MKTKNRSFKTAAICGALAVLSLVNVCVLSFNKSQVNPILTRNVNADAGPIGFIFGYLMGEYSQSNKEYFRYDEAQTVCNPVNISRGTLTQDQIRSWGLALNANTTQGTTTLPLEAGVKADVKYSKNKKGDYEFAVDIILPGDKWKVKACEPCGPDDPDVLSSKCVDYDQCAQIVNKRITLYKQALGL